MNIESAINEVLAYARDDAHGYQLRSRDLDYGLDCAGLMMLYASLVEGVPFARGRAAGALPQLPHVDGALRAHLSWLDVSPVLRGRKESR